MLRTLTAILLCLTFIQSGGCSTNPATGRSQFILLSSEEVSTMGEEAMPELIDEYGGEVESPELRQYVRSVGEGLVQYVEPQFADLNWEFTVLDSEVINAFALPGGKVFISRGLLARFTNEAQVAGVLGHEIGHVTGRHIDERISHAMAVQGIAVGASAAAGRSESEWAAIVPLVVGVGGQGYLLKFGRDQESESDTLGMRYMVEAGYDPEGMLEVLQVLLEASEGARQPEFLSTHPHPETRIRTINALLAERYAYTQNNSEFRKYEDRFLQQAAPYLPPPEGSAGMAPAAPGTLCQHCAGVRLSANLSETADIP